MRWVGRSASLRLTCPEQTYQQILSILASELFNFGKPISSNEARA